MIPYPIIHHHKSTKSSQPPLRLSYQLLDAPPLPHLHHRCPLPSKREIRHQEGLDIIIELLFLLNIAIYFQCLLHFLQVSPHLLRSINRRLALQICDSRQLRQIVMGTVVLIVSFERVQQDLGYRQGYLFCVAVELQNEPLDMLLVCFYLFWGRARDGVFY
jgi:hypothetical protein